MLIVDFYFALSILIRTAEEESGIYISYENAEKK
jgi:hypothetical protein